MKTLKVALLVTTAAGAVAAGGVTYATVGNSSPAPSAQAAKDVAAAKHAPAAKAPAAPAIPAVPACVPNLPKGQKLEAAKAKVEQQIKALAAKAPQAPVTLPAGLEGKLPTGIKGIDGLPAGKLTKVLPAGELAKLPVSKLPTCKAGEEKGTSATPSLPTKPGLPALPALPAKVSCDSVPKTIKNEEARAKEFTLPNGMQFAVAHAHKVVIQSRAACVYTQELVAGTRKMLTIDRIQTPPQVTLRELAAGLRMPGDFVSVSGVDTWRSPAGQGMLWYSDKGYALRVTSATPAGIALVPGIASQLRTQ
jgi:hypothetical protein